MLKKQVILQFPSLHEIESFVESVRLGEYTLHKQLPVLFARLSAATIEVAVNEYKAQEIKEDNNFGCMENPMQFID